MRAAVFQGAKTPLQLMTVPDPVPAAGEVVLKVENCGICGSDLHITGLDLVPHGTVLGHEFAGEIVELGENVAPGWQVGDRVTAVPVMACGHCEACRKGFPGLCQNARFIGTTLETPGAYAQYVRAPASMLLRLPDGLSFEDGALVEPLSVSHHAVKLAGDMKDAAVLVIGAGPIGVGVALFARLFGARHVVVSEPAEGRQQRALAVGATAAINPKAGPVAEAFADIAGGRPDIVFECVGLPGFLQQAMELASVRGRVVVAGVCFGEDRIQPLTGMAKEVNIQFSQTYTEEDFRAVIEALVSGRAPAGPMRTKVIGFSELPGMFEALRHPGEECKVLLAPNH